MSDGHHNGGGACNGDDACCDGDGGRTTSAPAIVNAPPAIAWTLGAAVDVAESPMRLVRTLIQVSGESIVHCLVLICEYRRLPRALQLGYEPTPPEPYVNFLGQACTRHLGFFGYC